jgi:hypothetical protein
LSNSAQKCDAADYNALKQIADAKHERQLMAVNIDKKGSWSAAAAASADISTARHTHTVAKACVAAV